MALRRTNIFPIYSNWKHFHYCCTRFLSRGRRRRRCDVEECHGGVILGISEGREGVMLGISAGQRKCNIRNIRRADEV